MRSAFLIDCSKKCLLPGPEVTIGSAKYPASLFGDLKEENLKSIGFVYKENFEEGSKALAQSFNKMTKPIATAINAILKSLPIIGQGVSVDSADDLRSKAIEAYALLETVLKNDPQGTTKILDDLNFMYNYNLPMRKNTPWVDMKLGGITIDFAYGKCNIFDAYWEVWQPLMILKNHFFPVFEQDLDKHYGQIRNYATVPYTTQALPSIVKAIRDEWSNASGGKSFGAHVKEITQSAKDFATAQAEAEKAQQEWDAKIREVLKAPSKANKIGEKMAEKITSEVDAEPLKRALKAEGLKGASAVSEGWGPFDWGEVKQEEVDARTTANTNLQQAWSEFQKAVTDKKDAVFAQPAYTVKTEPKTDSNTKDDILKILDTLATIEPKIVGQAVDNLAGQLTNLKSLYFGFKQDFANDLDRVKEKCQSSESLISLTNIIPTDVEITFDFDHVDENGYPMSGKFSIKNIWSVTPAGGSLSLREH